MAVLGSGRKKGSTVTSFLPNSHRRTAGEKGRNTAFRTKARHGVASRPLRRLGVAALLIRGGGDAEIVGKQRYDRLCSNAASSSSSSSFTPRRRRSLRERKMREVKGEGKQTKREKGGRDKTEGEGMEGRRKREPVRVLRPRQLSLQVAMVTGLSDQHTSYVLQAPSITSKSTSSRCPRPYTRESKTTLPRRHHVSIKHHITRRNLKTYKNHRVPQSQHGACNHRIASVHHSKLRSLACSHASRENSPRTPVKTPGPNRMLYANLAANSSAIRQQNKHVSEHSGVLRLSRRMRGLPPDTSLNILNALFATPNNSNSNNHPRNCKIQQHKDPKVMLSVNKVIQERLGFVRQDTSKETRHPVGDGDGDTAAGLATDDGVRNAEEIQAEDAAWSQVERPQNICLRGNDGDVGEVHKDEACAVSEDRKDIGQTQFSTDGQEVGSHVGEVRQPTPGYGIKDTLRSGKVTCEADDWDGGGTSQAVFCQDNYGNNAAKEDDGNVPAVPANPAREKIQPATSTRTITRAAVAKANAASATVPLVTHASVDSGKKTNCSTKGTKPAANSTSKFTHPASSSSKESFNVLNNNVSKGTAPNGRNPNVTSKGLLKPSTSVAKTRTSPRNLKR